VEDSAALKHSACGSTPSTLQVVEPPGVLGAATQPEKGRPAALSHEAAERYTHLGLRIAQCQPCKPALTHKHALGPTEGATPHTPRPKRGVVSIVEEGENLTPQMALRPTGINGITPAKAGIAEGIVVVEPDAQQVVIVRLTREATWGKMVAGAEGALDDRTPR